MALTRFIFLRFLGFIYLIAFLSLWVQIPGLIGSEGILPANDFLRIVHTHFGSSSGALFPTLFWAGSSDLFLQGTAIIGALTAVLLVAGVFPVLCLGILWALYLSYGTVCGDFLHFQWDILLLESGFLAIFFAPFRFLNKASDDSGPSRLVTWLFRWLLFRLMFSSGAVKLLSGDAVWRNLTALTYHYQTQPLPTWAGWMAHQLPANFQIFSCALMFLIELVAPFFIFGPRRFRIAAFFIFTFFQCLILATGNYCFFNLLAMALSVLLLDDRFFGRPKAECRARREWPKLVTIPLAVFILLLSVAQASYRYRLPHFFEKSLDAFTMKTAPFSFVNSYGLFAVMTTTRPEIIVEGSDDGEHWSAYEFRYKPGDLSRAPMFVEPHQPRLDWQMWFAALGGRRQPPWFLAFMRKLLQGSKPVLALLENNPFRDHPPRFVRAVLYQYHFTNWKEKKETGHWWARTPMRIYCPPISLESFQRG